MLLTLLDRVLIAVKKWRDQAFGDVQMPVSFSEGVNASVSRNAIHLDCHKLFKNLPPEIRRHRQFFSRKGRGFGEDALHTMWFLLFEEFRPKHCLEIGVYRGQVLSLWSLLAARMGYDVELTGISPFTSAGDEVSRYNKNINYKADTNSNLKRFGASNVRLIEAFSTDSFALSALEGEKYDLIYIDGSHDLDVVTQDYHNSKGALRTGGLLVIDDSSTYMPFSPPPYSFAGHPGPSKIVRDLALLEMKFLGGVGHNNVFIKI